MNTIIIAEAGVNHNGDVLVAKQLIKEASKAGADYIKFQTFKADTLVTKTAKKSEYQLDTTSIDESQFDMLKKLELTDAMHIDLKTFAMECGIGFLSSPFDIKSALFLHRLGVDYIKIPSGEINNLPFLRVLAKLNVPLILSTGMSNLNEIKDAYEIIKSAPKVYILHCNTQYPTPITDVNLNVIKTLKTTFGDIIGYSDHTLGIEVSLAAVALGAKVIEKHFTLDKNMEGPDHSSSLNPSELASLVHAIRNIEKALGSSIKSLTASEKKNVVSARKSIVASHKIRKGEVFTVENITTKRPATGLTPMSWDDVIGKIAKKDYLKDEMIEL